jgi:hypothetical protein
MSSRHRRKSRGGKFVKLDEYVLRSPARRALTMMERCAYVELKRRYNGTNNGTLGLGCQELADNLGVGRSAAANALAGLERKGFIARQRLSGFNVKNRAATEWRLTEHRNDVNGDLPSKEFMRFDVEKSKTQSAWADAQSIHADCDPQNHPESGRHSPLRRTVSIHSRGSQSA